MLDDFAGVYLGQSLKREAVALFLFFHPGQQSLLDDPAA
jgi:hypothetical protein